MGEMMTDFGEEMKELITKEVEQAIEKAMEAVRQSLAEWAIESKITAAKQMGAVEDRISRSMDWEGTIINPKRNDQLNIQAEVNSTLTDFQSIHLPTLENLERIKNHPGAVVNMVKLDPVTHNPCSCGCQFSFAQNQVSNPNQYYSVEYRPPPAPPHLFHSPEPPPSLSSYLYTTEFSAQQMFDASPDRNLVLIDETLDTSYTSASNISPFTLTYHTTLSTGQLYYGIDTTTTAKECSKMKFSIENLSSDNKLPDQMSERNVNEGEKSAILLSENDVVIGDGSKSLEMVVKLRNESIMEKSSGGNVKDGDDEKENLTGIFLELGCCLNELEEDRDKKTKGGKNSSEDVNVENNSDLQFVDNDSIFSEVVNYKKGEVESDMKIQPLKGLREPDDNPDILVNYNGENKQFFAEEMPSMFLPEVGELSTAFPINVSENNVLIYDPGGGGFDMYYHTSKEFLSEVKVMASDTCFRGEDINIIKLFVKGFERKNERDHDGHTVVMMIRLRTACRTPPSTAQTTIEIDSVFKDLKIKFEKFNASDFTKSMVLIGNCLTEANIEKCFGQNVILIDGSTRTPKFQQLLQIFFYSNKLYMNSNSKKAVDYGTAVQVVILKEDWNEYVQDSSLLDVTPLLPVLETAGGSDFLILRNTTISTKEQDFSTYSFNWMELINPSELFGDNSIDYPYLECTSVAIEALSTFMKLYPGHRREEIRLSIEKAASFIIESKQESDGSWYGSWAVCFTYGTWFGIKSLIAAGRSFASCSSIRKACDFLLSKQVASGGVREARLVICFLTSTLRTR